MPLKEKISFYVGPLLGLVVLVLVVTLHGWLFHYNTIVSLLIFSGLLGLGFLPEKQKGLLFRDCLVVFAFTIIVSIPILASALRFDAFNPFTESCLAIGGMVCQVVPVSRLLCLALCTLPAFTMNGFVSGAQWGFFPQTYGLAFASGLACLFPGIAESIIHLKQRWFRSVVQLFPLALCFSAFLISYNNMLPVMGGGAVLFLIALFFISKGMRLRIIGFSLISLAEVIMIVNLEGFRILKNFINGVLCAGTMSIRFGWSVL